MSPSACRALELAEVGTSVFLRAVCITSDLRDIGAAGLPTTAWLRQRYGGVSGEGYECMIVSHDRRLAPPPPAQPGTSFVDGCPCSWSGARDTGQLSRVTSLVPSQYSFSLTTFSPSGKLVQIEYALNAVNAGATSLGIKATNGVVIATERKLPSILVDETTV